MREGIHKNVTFLYKTVKLVGYYGVADDLRRSTLDAIYGRRLFRRPTSGHRILAIRPLDRSALRLETAARAHLYTRGLKVGLRSRAALFVVAQCHSSGYRLLQKQSKNRGWCWESFIERQKHTQNQRENCVRQWLSNC
ncbi:hypothetical protein EVAR_21414_1 [Eumeta japonica]|uniref:Uncharacterized protein n=1 Tax=Eumeta variegata TaxID=151549 RepID=A0A4C1VH33_EUMVA|nr:hypothetical protein EVAR_21414_1 [Eumeta japonica]